MVLKSMTEGLSLSLFRGAGAGHARGEDGIPLIHAWSLQTSISTARLSLFHAAVNRISMSMTLAQGLRIVPERVEGVPLKDKGAQKGSHENHQNNIACMGTGESAVAKAGLHKATDRR